MKKNPVVKFLLTTLIGGAVFLVPVGVITWVGYQAVLVMMMVAKPLAAWLPVDTVGGIALANLIALVVVILLCFVAGLVARHTIAGRLMKKLDGLLINVPGYSIIRGIKSGFDETEANSVQPVLVRFDDSERVGLEMQRLEDGRVITYIPSCPSAWSGVTHLVEPSRVTALDISVRQVMELVEQYGFGANTALADHAQRNARISP
ncbi:DUF502 domain-containing protein [Marinihelvus fidelis]|uniref:DUF502 domain-containing protein n=1 Tax=Marinihelvus fidelis TaxID=2613842 RepID=A0A5N0TDL8_9GAMM|nr:DUF502 domain-containing protein [Marinihelvus fidelis]KAA9131936.1 DUF502 domain-containing protein [Marinihelvus fidelis]